MTAILKLDHYRNEKPKTETGIIRKPGSKKLYVDLRPNGIRVQRSSGLDDTPENRQILRAWVDRQQARIKDGTFEFAEAFPNAPEKDKATHAALENRAYKPDNNRILFEDYLKKWIKKNIDNFPKGRKKDYSDIIEYRIRPFFKDKTFGQITGITIKDFIKTLVWMNGPKKGSPLSASRVSNIMIVIRAIWYDAVEEYQWERSDPFQFVKQYLKRDLKTRPQKPAPQVFRFDEWHGVIENINPYHRPVAEFMIMTGTISSEIAGLKKSAIHGDRIHIDNSIVKGHEKSQLKTDYRKRDIPMTAALKKILDSVWNRSDSEYIFTTKAGGNFNGESFRKNAWAPALKKAGIKYRVPYSTRHTFAAWSLTLRMDTNKLVNLMGHGSKKMVFEVYGKYVEGLESDAGNISKYFGNDFNYLTIKKPCISL
nr:DUF3596 domain-containing protein [uncultured Desulfobacter sp.]